MRRTTKVSIATAMMFPMLLACKPNPNPSPSTPPDDRPLQSAFQPAPTPEPTSKRTLPQSLKQEVALKPLPQPTKGSNPKTYTLRPVRSLYNQSAIDQCKLVLWMTSPTNLIAAHDKCGYAWLDNIPNGSIVVVVGTTAAGRYKIVGHKWQSGKGGPIPSWMSNYDLVLHTCTSTGTGFSLAMRIS